MRIPKPLLLLILLPFLVLTLYAVSQVGYVGIFTYHLPSPAGWQVFADLVVALVLVCSWMIVDARRNQRNVIPYLIATLFLGSIGPLAYLLLAPARDRATDATVSTVS